MKKNALLMTLAALSMANYGGQAQPIPGFSGRVRPQPKKPKFPFTEEEVAQLQALPPDSKAKKMFLKKLKKKYGG